MVGRMPRVPVLVLFRSLEEWTLAYMCEGPFDVTT